MLIGINVLIKSIKVLERNYKRSVRTFAMLICLHKCVVFVLRTFRMRGAQSKANQDFFPLFIGVSVQLSDPDVMVQ